jgi:hypothetical protein
MAGRVGGQTAKGLMPLALLGDRAAAAALVGRDDDVDEALEEVAL